MKFVIIAALAVVALASEKPYYPKPTYPAPAYAPPAYGKSYDYAPMPYSFDWAVLDQASYNDFGQKETSDGKLVSGTYYVVLPDGRRQVVTYKADDYGYIADVMYDGEAKYPEYKPAYPAYPKPAYAPPAYPKPAYPTPAYSKPTYAPPAYPKAPYPEPSYPTYPRPSYPTYPRPAYPSYPRPSYPSYPKPSYPFPSTTEAAAPVKNAEIPVEVITEDAEAAVVVTESVSEAAAPIANEAETSTDAA
ncbi:hypothetical protein GHT06_015462 [Daphnia sinensis]|uniref:Cuticle protein n=1 Tax=Daphnia sinensis TaxID=1820382 RepID=A0AAD5PUN7_9CRUS|nr:hypothetical protein GHT06_015462 [Daphnia sinensis]